MNFPLAPLLLLLSLPLLSSFSPTSLSASSSSSSSFSSSASSIPPLPLSSLSNTSSVINTYLTLPSSSFIPPNPPPFDAVPGSTPPTLISLATLRELFGSNSNEFWGDLSNSQTRLLYHQLLPRALLSIQQSIESTDPTIYSATTTTGIRNRAFLASHLRSIAKSYARYRCNVPGRVLASFYDGFRHFREFGYWRSDGLTWEEVWEKYYLEIISEAGALAAPGEFDDTVDPLVIEKDVCWRILERSCSTNEQIDRLFLTQPLAADEQVGERKLSMGEEVVMRLALASDDVKHPAVDRIKPKPGSKPEPALSMSRDDVDDDSSALYNSPSLTKILGFLRPQKPLTPRRFGQLREKLGNRQLRDRERAARIANDKKKC